MNKVLKDIVVKFQSVGLQKYSPYVPGWDCHGLPIEWKIEELNKKRSIKLSYRLMNLEDNAEILQVNG